MKTNKLNLYLLIAGSFLISCTGNVKKSMQNMENEYEKGTFGYDLNYLSKKDSLIVLKSDDEKAQVIVSAKYQAKVFTSTVNGKEGNSLGFVNYRFFDAGIVDEHMNGFGGENRFWLGPEGGQYSIFFEPGKEQVYDNWHTPKGIDIEAWEIREATTKSATLAKEMTLQNYRGNNLQIAVERTISLVTNSEIATSLNITIPQNVQAVAYATQNRITNQNDYEWTPETGTVCIWMLDMFIPSDSAVTIIPYRTGDESSLGKVVTSDYFGEIPSDRLIDGNGVIYFKTDGKARGKLGMNAKRTLNIAGNYDPISKRLTVVTFDTDPKATYLNQEWNPDKDPLTGDALNAYNDGPLEDGSIMGPFLELESSSPAAFLQPGESLSHQHNVYHFVGEEADLSRIAKSLLGVELKKIKSIL
ncbi:DUF6786 family protein [Petrimonas mucosa]|jgi:hypothetical protein|uniref:DUF6786 family protein n=2 Tax=Petrimonas mucosa TaxID=1642646 RepID=UPI0008E1B161|nr:DUF6786 family protein [Petrimonas mucosa]MDD3561496.1 hypothetical protein [Petrimonas mucosa]SFU58192.1 hypothetical protein SAMN05216364_102914 [Porphyromonadaceae bacterium KHP3R9]